MSPGFPEEKTRRRCPGWRPVPSLALQIVNLSPEPSAWVLALSSSSSLPHVAHNNELEQERGSESSGTHRLPNRW